MERFPRDVQINRKRNGKYLMKEVLEIMKIYFSKRLKISLQGINAYIIFLIIVGTLSLNSCSSTHPTHHDYEPSGVHFSPSSYMLEDMGHKIHRYKENIQILHLPLQNPKLTQYCMVHYKWEDIHVLRKLPPRLPGLKSKHHRRPLLIIQYRVIPHKK
jgi:hypothetical protein